MGASLLYAPVAKGKPFGGGSSLVEMLRELKGDSLGVFDAGDISTLRGMAIAGVHERKSLHELIEAIEMHGPVRVWAEY